MELFFIGLSAALNLIIVGLGIYFKKSIESYIDFRRLTAVETLKREMDECDAQRKRMQLVAELFARRFNKPNEVFEFEKLNWELALFLPKELVCQISEKLVLAKTKHDAFSLFIEIRKLLGRDDGLGADNIAYMTEVPQPITRE